MRLHAEAPAKINRELRVGALRADGFHEVFSRIVAIALSDAVTVAPSPNRLVFTCAGGAPADDTNLVVRAARALAAHLNRVPAARIHLEKRIPAGGGLGGGSSDAAATLLLLDRLWGARLPMAELAAVAAALGSDVPFFLHGGEADVTGRGERVRPMADRPGEDLLLVVPPFPISTARVYAAYDRGAPRPLPDRLAVDHSTKFFGPNDLAFAVLETEVRMRGFVESVQSLSDDFAISGSGSAIVVRGADARIEESLLRRHPDARLIRSRTLTREEYQRRSAISGGS